MYSAKHAHQYLDKVKRWPLLRFYMDVRCAGKGYDEFYRTPCKMAHLCSWTRIKGFKTANSFVWAKIRFQAKWYALTPIW